MSITTNASWKEGAFCFGRPVENLCQKCIVPQEVKKAPDVVADAAQAVKEAAPSAPVSVKSCRDLPQPIYVQDRGASNALVNPLAKSVVVISHVRRIPQAWKTKGIRQTLNSTPQCHTAKSSAITCSCHKARTCIVKVLWVCFGPRGMKYLFAAGGEGGEEGTQRCR